MTALLAACPSLRATVQPPAYAAALSHNKLTYGATRWVLGTDIFDWTLLNSAPTPGQTTQNANGSLTLADCSATIGSGGKYGATICTLTRIGGVFKGKVFGGGGTFIVRMRFNPAVVPPGGILPFPCWFALDYEFLRGTVRSFSGAGPTGQQRIEIDGLQYLQDSASFWQPISGRHFYGVGNTASVVDTPSGATVETKFGEVDPTKFNDYAFSWKPATSITKGFIKAYVNGIERRSISVTPSICQWSLYNSASPSPPVKDSTAMAVADTMMFAPIVGTSAACAPMDVEGLYIWQPDESQNLTL